MSFSFKQFPILETERLILRVSSYADSQAIWHIRSDREINRYIKRAAPKNIKDAQDFIDKVNRSFEKEESIYWALCLKNNPGKMIGSICLWHFSPNRKRAELGYDLFPEYQGKGFMSEAINAVMMFGYDKLALTEMEAFTHFDNKDSIKLLLMNGFKLVKDEKDPDNSNNLIFRIRKAHH